MQRSVQAAIFLLLFLGGVQLNAQSAQSADFFQLEEITECLLDLEAQNDIFPQASGADVLFIDFEKIHVNLSDLVIKDQKGRVVFEDELWNLPVDAIYEIDFSQFEKGNYHIELRSFTKVVRTFKFRYS